MQKHLFTLPLFIIVLSLYLASAHDTPIGDCISCCGDTVIQNTTKPSNETIEYKLGYNISVPKKTFCVHDSIYNFQVSYVLGTGD